MTNNDKVVKEPKDIENFRTEEGKNSFDFTGVTFKCAMDFPGYFSKIIKENNFKEKASFEKAVFQKDVSFEKTQFLGDALFGGAQFSENANFHLAQFSEKASFWGTQFSENATFQLTKFSGNANFHLAKFSGNAKFWLAKFSGNANFWRAKFSGEADFQEAKFSENATFQKSQFSGNAQFRAAQFSRNADFEEADFSGDADFWITSFNKVYFNGTIFKIISRLRGAGAYIKEGDRETYRIIKDELLKFNNRIEALEYYKKEMKAYWQELYKEKWYKNIGEKCILCLNRISTNYGSSWIQGAGFTALTAFIFYLAFLGLSNNPVWSLEAYFIFLNPAHSYEFLQKFNPYDWAYMIDAFGRIFIGYGYYQTIQAFRKHKI